MPPKQPSLLDLKSFTQSKIREFFSVVERLKTEKPQGQLHGQTIALLFFEASTRTRMSFETAAYRIGLGPVLLDAGMKSSLEKGESIEDSILNVAAMGHAFLVIRCADQIDLQAIAQRIQPIVINAGWGAKGHPTQALLDVFTMHEKLGDLAGKKVVFLGDIRHSRVAASHFEILSNLGAEMILCSPDEYLPDQHPCRVIQDLPQAVAQADVLMALRCQFERHESKKYQSAKEEYRKKFGLNLQSIRGLKKSALIMHPGPVNHGIEIETEVMSHPQCQILAQVANGVIVREAILRLYLEGKMK